jgi:hypothetical protein
VSKKKKSKEKIEREEEKKKKKKKVNVQGWKVYYGKENSALLKEDWKKKLIEYVKGG